jgi:hypothetical protein
MLQDQEDSTANKNKDDSEMIDSEASPIGNQSDPRGAGKRTASGPDSSDNELMAINQQLPNG